MIKKIKIEQLKPGMFIQDLNCGWLEHPFLSNSLTVGSEKTVEKIADHGIREVYIDTDRGMDVGDAPAKEEISRRIDAGINKIAGPVNETVNRVHVQVELATARKIKAEARQSVETLMKEVRLGKQVELEKIDHVVEKMVDSICRNKDALTSLGRIKKTDEYTFMHSVSVGVLMISFGRHMGFDNKLIKELGVGGLLHDIGKVNVPADIISCSRKLSDDEYHKVKEHVKHSRDILEKTPNIAENSLLVASGHHERMDGTGYPDKLKKDQISIYAQMAAIADVYDAMTSNRCYQKQYQPTETLKKLYEWDNAYNPELVHQFIRCVGIYPVGSFVKLKSGMLGIVIDHGDKSLLYPTVKVVYDSIEKKYIMPRDIDLSVSGQDYVANYEDPEKWQIDTERYL